MELKQYLSILRKWWWLLLVTTLIAAGASYWRTQQMAPLYRSSTTLMVGRFIDDPNPSNEDIFISERLAETYARMAGTRPILASTVESLGLDMPWGALANQVNASAIPQSQLLVVSVVDTDPERARQIADAVAQQLVVQSPTTPSQEQQENREFVSQQLAKLKTKIEDAEAQMETLEQRLALENSARGIQDIRDQTTALQQKIDLWQSNYAQLLSTYEGGRTNFLSVIEPATAPANPFSPRVAYNVLLAAAFGLLLAGGAAFAIEYLNDTIETKEDVERVLNLSTLGVITKTDSKTSSDPLITLSAPHSPTSEAYRFLRTSILFSGLTNPTITLLVTSADERVGKTTIASNLAVTMARAGKDTILVDTDLRRPSIHHLFGVSNGFGLTSLLLDRRRSVESVLVETEVPNLKLLPSGPLPPNPAELLLSEPMQRRLEQLTNLADVIIFDSPPVLAVDDATILSTLCTGCMLVVDATSTRSSAMKRSQETLSRVGARILGVALNKVPAHRSEYAYHYSYLSEDEPNPSLVKSGEISG